MKKTIILAAALSVFSITATFAQAETDKPVKKEKTEKAGGHRNPMADLNLSKDQENQMKTLNEDTRSKADAIKNDASLSDEQRKAKMMELRKAQNEKRMAILTPEQKKKWEKQRKERGEKGKNKGN